jgi:MoaA/NifB/PqqE/SkfB family radical SAM enzyme
METKTLIAVQPKSKYFDNIVKIEWFIGLLCNFSCSYCAEFSRSGFAEKEKILHGVRLLKKKLTERTPLILLGGGEPSIHPDIFEIVKTMHSNNFKVSMISNGSRAPQDYLDLLNYMEGITFSVHFEQKYEKTLKTIDLVKNTINKTSEKYLQINVMMVPGYFNEAKEVVSYLEKNNIDYIIRRIRPLIDEKSNPILPTRVIDRQIHEKDSDIFDKNKNDWGYYSSDEIEYLNSRVYTVKQNSEEIWGVDSNEIERTFSNSNEISLRKLNKFKNWTCNIGIERLHIYNDGSVYRNTCKVGGKLGNIYEDFEIPSKPVVCTKDVCTCAWAINVSKIKANRYSNLIRANL